MANGLITMTLIDFGCRQHGPFFSSTDWMVPKIRYDRFAEKSELVYVCIFINLFRAPIPILSVNEGPKLLNQMTHHWRQCHIFKAI